MFISIVLVAMVVLFVVICLCDKAIVNTLVSLDKNIVKPVQSSLLESRRLPEGTMEVWENGVECQLHHDFPMYWPKKG